MSSRNEYDDFYVFIRADAFFERDTWLRKFKAALKALESSEEIRNEYQINIETNNIAFSYFLDSYLFQRKIQNSKK